MDHDWLMKMLEQRINDKRFLGLIRKWLKAGILEEDGQVSYPVTGTPQGGIVSAVLATIYLHYGLDLWFEKVVKPHCRGEAMIMRFADDFVCAFQYHDDMKKFYSVLGKRLGKFMLELSPEKTSVIRFSRFQTEKESKLGPSGFCVHEIR
jgi:retron-type reverse transcriptase